MIEEKVGFINRDERNPVQLSLGGTELAGRLARIRYYLHLLCLEQHFPFLAPRMSLWCLAIETIVFNLFCTFFGMSFPSTFLASSMIARNALESLSVLSMLFS